MNGDAGLRVSGLSVRYGGHLAVDDVSLEAPLGRITGLVGPNGAGKTTMFNSCSGIVRPQSGEVEILGRDVSHQSIARRGRLGLGRTFQKVELCGQMSVRDNVAIGLHARNAGGNPFRQLVTSSRETRSIRERVEESIIQCGLDNLADRKVASISTGQRRLVELARVLAADFSVLLLDEPSSGLDDAETRVFGSILGAVVAERGVAILLVEHDMSLVMSICNYVFVLDFGKLLFQGTTQETATSEVVQAAYLGSEAVGL